MVLGKLNNYMQNNELLSNTTHKNNLEFNKINLNIRPEIIKLLGENI